MRRLVLLIMALNTFIPTQAQEAEAKAFLDQWNAAMVASDTASLDAMMDDDIVLHHMSGATQSKREWLTDVARGTFRYHKVEKRRVKVTSQDDGTLLISFTSTITATVWGSRGTWTLSGSMRLARRNDRWIRIE